MPKNGHIPPTWSIQAQYIRIISEKSASVKKYCTVGEWLPFSQIARGSRSAGRGVTLAAAGPSRPSCAAAPWAVSPWGTVKRKTGKGPETALVGAAEKWKRENRGPPDARLDPGPVCRAVLCARFRTCSGIRFSRFRTGALPAGRDFFVAKKSEIRRLLLLQ